MEQGKQMLLKIILLLPGILCCIPIFYQITGSIISQGQIKEFLTPIFIGGEEYAKWTIVPQYPTFMQYYKLLFQTPAFFILFWNSVNIVLCIIGGQMVIGVPAAWAFAVFNVPGKKLLFSIYIALMLIPFQVTMLSSYIILGKLQLLDTQGAVIFPAIFSTLPVFIIYGCFRQIPTALFEAAQMDGASAWYIFRKIGLPLSKLGILSAIILGFMEYWNMFEQPMAYIERKVLWPLTLYLPELSWNQAGTAFCVSIFTLLPSTLVFLSGQNYLEQGIIYPGITE